MFCFGHLSEANECIEPDGKELKSIRKIFEGIMIPVAGIKESRLNSSSHCFTSKHHYSRPKAGLRRPAGQSNGDRDEQLHRLPPAEEEPGGGGEATAGQSRPPDVLAG